MVARRNVAPPGKDRPEPSGAKSLTVTQSDQPIAILVVDDDEDCRALIRDAITGCNVGSQVFEANNGQEALDFLERRGRFASAPRPGLIYLDVEMPVMDGLEAVRRIKADPRFRDIPVVMTTGVSDDRQMRQCAAAGANSYTVKPANAEQFFRTILASTNYWLAIHQQPEPAAEGVIGPPRD